MGVDIDEEEDDVENDDEEDTDEEDDDGDDDEVENDGGDGGGLGSRRCSGAIGCGLLGVENGGVVDTASCLIRLLARNI